MPAQSISAKALAYLAEGRVRAEHVDAATRSALFRVLGTAPVPYQVRYAHGAWRCTCPARVRCCHITACALVAAPTTTPVPGPARAAARPPAPAPAHEEGAGRTVPVLAGCR